MSRKIQKSIQINKSIDTVFKALITPSKIKEWWSATNAIVVPKKNGIYAMTWGEDIDDPEYITICRIKALQSPKRLVLLYEDYLTKSGGLPFEAEFMVEFNLVQKKDETLLIILQSGFPDDVIAEDYYKDCETAWDAVLLAIKKVVEV